MGSWVGAFVHGCVPVIFARNAGGRIEGIKDQAEAIEKINSRVRGLLKEHFDEKKNSHFNEAWRERFTLRPETDDKQAVVLPPSEGAASEWRPYAIITLNNKRGLERMYTATKDRNMWFPGRLSKKVQRLFPRGEEEWVVRLNDSDAARGNGVLEHTVLRGAIKRKGRAPKGSKEWHPGMEVCVKMSDEFRTKKPLLAKIPERTCADGVSRRRALFIIDEADLSFASPGHDRNARERAAHQDKITLPVSLLATPVAKEGGLTRASGETDEDETDDDDIWTGDDEDDRSDDEDGLIAMEDRHGAREWAFATVSITATPAALLITSASIAARFRPCIAVVDQPSNYVCYFEQLLDRRAASAATSAASSPASASASDPRRTVIERMPTELRQEKLVRSKSPYYHLFFTQPGTFSPWCGGDEQHPPLVAESEWSEAMDASRLSGKRVDLGAYSRENFMEQGAFVGMADGFKLKYNQRSGGFTVYKPRDVDMTDIADAIIRTVESRADGALEESRRGGVMEDDAIGIQAMVEHMANGVLEHNEPYRQGLIVTEKTKKIPNQKTFQNEIVGFANSQNYPLAVVTCALGGVRQPSLFSLSNHNPPSPSHTHHHHPIHFSRRQQQGNDGAPEQCSASALGTCC